MWPQYREVGVAVKMRASPLAGKPAERLRPFWPDACDAVESMLPPVDGEEQPVRTMANLFPMAMLLVTPACDLVGLVTGDPGWARAAFYFAFVGAVGAAVVALPQAIDWLALPGDARRARAVAVSVTGAAVVLAGLSTVVRLAGGAAGFSPLPLALACAAAALLVVSGWLGGAATSPTTTPRLRGSDRPHHA
jgi:uncharacterized membrane protein